MKQRKVCPISYEPVGEFGKYSREGLKQLSRSLPDLQDLPLSAEALRFEAIKRAHKMSIQGVQVKLSARLNVTQQRFDFVDTYGTFIIKPQNDLYAELPENEDLSMRMAACAGIEVPLYGMVYAVDGSVSYFIKRFDRYGHHKKRCVEDFAQLARLSRDEKYSFSMEKVVQVLDDFCTFPLIEKKKLFVRTIFNYLIGNEDMHAKNFSLIRNNGKIELSPAYDLLNTTLALGQAKEELALPLNGKKSNMKRSDFVDYFAYERLGLNEQVVNKVLQQMAHAQCAWNDLLNKSFLSDEKKEAYRKLIAERREVLMI